MPVEFSAAAMGVLRAMAAPGKSRWLPEEIKLKLPTKQTNTNLHSLSV